MSEISVYPPPNVEVVPSYPPPSSSVITQTGPNAYAIVTTSGERGPAGPSLPIVFYRPQLAEVATGRARYRFPFPAQLIGWSAALSAAPVGSDLEFDVVANGASTLFSGVVPDGDEDVPEVPLAIGIAVGDYITVNVTAIGSDFAGEGLSIFIRYLA